MARHTYSSISACTSLWVLVERFNGFNPIQKPKFSLRKLSVGRKQQPLIETQLLIAFSTTQRIRLNFNFAVYSFSLSSFSGCEIRGEMNIVHVKFYWIITVWKSQTELIYAELHCLTSTALVSAVRKHTLHTIMNSQVAAQWSCEYVYRTYSGTFIKQFYYK